MEYPIKHNRKDAEMNINSDDYDFIPLPDVKAELLTTAKGKKAWDELQTCKADKLAQKDKNPKKDYQAG